ncbi:MAG: NADH oxidase [Gammaproteobacteria bacterium]|nr:NADH oxidase [Gammaproteobacteria bacterium]
MTTGLQLFSKITQQGQLELSLVEVDVPDPGPGQVLVKMQASPINPSDMWPMFGPADLTDAKLEYNDDRRVLTAPIAAPLVKIMKSRLDQVLPIGNEGAGVVVKAGEGAESLMGKTVGLSSGNAYAEYCCVPAVVCLPLHDGTTAREGASSFVNPLTALGMVETMKIEGHTALVHTAAASNLGQMLNKICIADGVPLVNVVRKPEQVEILRGLGAEFIVDSSAETYQRDLAGAIAATGATLAFDAIGGGQLASDILAAMERNLSKDAVGLNTYGSETLKQVYLYGGLDVSPTILNRSYGMVWAIGGWLLPHFLKRVGLEKTAQLQKRVADEIKTTFASNFTSELSFKEAMTPEIIARYVAKKTGEKYLINPGKGA